MRGPSPLTYVVKSAEPLAVFTGDFPGTATERLLRVGSTVAIAKRRRIEVWGTTATMLYLAAKPTEWVVASWMGTPLLVPSSEAALEAEMAIDAPPPTPTERSLSSSSSHVVGSLPLPPPPPPPAVPPRGGARALLYRNASADELCVLVGGFPGKPSGDVVGPDAVLRIRMAITTRVGKEVFRMLYLHGASGGWVLQELEGELLFARVLTAPQERLVVPLQREWRRRRRHASSLAAATTVRALLPPPPPPPAAVDVDDEKESTSEEEEESAYAGIARYVNVTNGELNVLAGEWPGEESGRVVASGGVVVVGRHVVVPSHSVRGPGPVPLMLQLRHSDGHWIISSWGDELLFARIMTLAEERSVVGVQAQQRRRVSARRVALKRDVRRLRAATVIARQCYRAPRARRVARAAREARQQRRAVVWLQRAWLRRRNGSALRIQLGWRVWTATCEALELKRALEKELGGMSRTLLPGGYAFVEKLSVSRCPAVASWIFRIDGGSLAFSVRDGSGALLNSTVQGSHGGWARGRAIVRVAGELSFEWSNNVSWWGEERTLLFKVTEKPLVGDGWFRQQPAVRVRGLELERARTKLVETRSMLSRVRAQRARLVSKMEVERHIAAELEKKREHHESEIAVVLRPQVAVSSQRLQRLLTARLHFVFRDAVAHSVAAFVGMSGSIAWASTARHHRDASSGARLALLAAARAQMAADTKRFGQRRARGESKLHCPAGHGMALDGRATRERRLCDRCHRLGIRFCCHRGCDHNVCQRCALACVAAYLGAGKRVRMSDAALEAEAGMMLQQLPTFGSRRRRGGEK